MSTSVDTMKNFFNVLKLYANDTTTDGVAILDHAVKTVSHFASLQDAVNHFLTDIANTTATTGNAWQSLYQNCGIAVGADYNFGVDTGSASGYNAGMGVVKNAQDIVPENALLTQFAVPAAGSATFHTYTGADGKTFSYAIQYPSNLLEVVDVSTGPPDEITGAPDSTYADTTYLQAGQSYSSLDDNYLPYRTQSAESIVASIQTIMKGIENFWADQSLKLIYDTYGLDFNGKVLTIKFGINQRSLAETGPIAGDQGLKWYPASNIVMMIDSVVYTPLDGADPNGNTYVANGSANGYLDRTFAHEMIHATMQASGTSKKGMPEFFTEGIAELIHGVDDYCGIRTNSLLALAADPERLATAVAFREGTMTGDAYPGGYMFMRYLLHQALPTQVVLGNGTTAELFTYTGGEEVISNAANGSQINFSAGIDISGSSVSGNDFFATTTAGNLIVRDARGKLLNFADSTGTVKTRGYFANAAGTIDGRGFGEYEVIVGADNANNSIIAGNGGSQLWGGIYGNDELFGGNGADVFVAGVACGNDKIYSAASNDRINLSATLDQITGTNVTSSGVTLNFSDGSSLAVAGTVGATFALTDGSTFVADQTSGQFTRTN